MTFVLHQEYHRQADDTTVTAHSIASRHWQAGSGKAAEV